MANKQAKEIVEIQISAQVRMAAEEQISKKTGRHGDPGKGLAHRQIQTQLLRCAYFQKGRLLAPLQNCASCVLTGGGVRGCRCLYRACRGH